MWSFATQSRCTVEIPLCYPSKGKVCRISHRDDPLGGVAGRSTSVIPFRKSYKSRKRRVARAILAHGCAIDLFCLQGLVEVVWQNERCFPKSAEYPEILRVYSSLPLMEIVFCPRRRRKGLWVTDPTSVHLRTGSVVQVSCLGRHTRTRRGPSV